jgi:chitin disaccharide deacetylase
MIIVNADDWGRSRAETDAAYSCFAENRINSVSAMVFMDDSERAAVLANSNRMDVGLHLNLNQPFTQNAQSVSVRECHTRVVSFMARHKYAQLFYNPFLKKALQCVYAAQVDEFCRLYGRSPSHVDGHQHRHLCTNMLMDEIIPAGQRVRRSFTFRPGEKSLANRLYRLWVDKRLCRRYVLTDYFFALSRCLQSGSLERVFQLGQSAKVELMTHPAEISEFEYLTSERHLQLLSRTKTGTFAMLSRQ